MTWKPYKVKPLKKNRPVRPGYVRKPANPGEVLTGYIGSFQASDIEERSVRSLESKGEWYKFRTQFLPSDPPIMISSEIGRDQLGAVEVDLLINPAGLMTGVNLDGDFAHKTAEQIESDRVKDTQLINILGQMGGIYFRVPGHFLTNQDQSDQTWNEILSGRRDFGISS